MCIIVDDEKLDTFLINYEFSFINVQLYLELVL